MKFQNPCVNAKKLVFRVEQFKLETKMWCWLCSSKEQQAITWLVARGYINKNNALATFEIECISYKYNVLELDAALRNLISTNGLSGLWNGLKPTLLRDVPFSAIYWGSYESIKGHLSANAAPDVTVAIVSGAAAATVIQWGGKEHVRWDNMDVYVCLSHLVSEHSSAHSL